jgi:hypothetical protein
MYIKDFNNIKSEDFLKEIKNIKIKNNSKSYNFTPIIFFIIDKIYERIFLKS